MRVTVERLIEYLGQYDPDTLVFLGVDELVVFAPEDDDYIVLDGVLDEVANQLDDWSCRSRFS